MGKTRPESYEYNRRGDLIEILIRDGSQRKIEQFKANLDDKKLCRKIISIIELKYDLSKPEINAKESINQKEKEKNGDTNWLDMNNDFFP